MVISSAWRRLQPRRRPHPTIPPHSARRRRRAAAPELASLERRELMTVVPRQYAILVSPALLPATGQAYPVRFHGGVASTRPELPRGFFHVTDEYRRYEPFGDVALTPVGAIKGLYYFKFDFTVKFPTTRSNNTPDGRHYFVLLGAKDADNTDGRTVGVFVPKTLPPTNVGQPTPAGPRTAAVPRRR